MSYFSDLRDSMESRCAWNKAGDCCQGIEQAHRSGWDQCKSEAIKVIKPEAYPNNRYIVSTIFECADAIASMEYKMEAKDE